MWTYHYFSVENTFLCKYTLFSACLNVKQRKPAASSSSVLSVTSFVKQQNTPSCKLHYHNNGSRRHYSNLSARLSTHTSISANVTAKTPAVKYSYLRRFDEFVDVFYSVYTGFPTVLGWMDASPEKVMTNHKQRLTSMRLDLRSSLPLTTLKGKGLFLYFEEIEVISQLIYYILLHMMCYMFTSYFTVLRQWHSNTKGQYSLPVCLTETLCDLDLMTAEKVNGSVHKPKPSVVLIEPGS